MSLAAVDLKILQNHLVNTCQEMALAMMRTSYSPIFSESLDFCTILFDREGEMLAIADINPAMLGSAALSAQWIIDELGADSFEPGDVVVDNDPYRGMCHMPEHLLLAPYFHDGELAAFVGNVAHVGEIGGKAPGSFASDATDIYQEGLRLPPVKLMSAGRYVQDIWKIMQANHRTPDNTWGDFNALIGSLGIGLRRLESLFGTHGSGWMQQAFAALFDHAEEWLQSQIQELPNGTYSGTDLIEDDGVEDRSHALRMRLTIEDERVIFDFTGTDPQARGPINAPYTVTFAAACNGLFQLFRDFPLNAGTFRPLRVIAPPGTIVNVIHPAPCVAGQTELQPRIIDMIQGQCLAQVVPDRIAAACGGTCSNFLFGGIHPDTGRYYAHYHFDGMGWGGRASADGNSACSAPHGNTPNTPVEVFESRFPLRHLRYSLRPDSGGPGSHRGGLGVIREFEVIAEEVTVSALYERMKVAPWGIRGGGHGARTELLIRRAGASDYRPFGEVFATLSPSKFTNVTVRRGDRILIASPGGGGYGPPSERAIADIEKDVLEGWVSPGRARADYGIE